MIKAADLTLLFASIKTQPRLQDLSITRAAEHHDTDEHFYFSKIATKELSLPDLILYKGDHNGRFGQITLTDLQIAFTQLQRRPWAGRLLISTHVPMPKVIFYRWSLRNSNPLAKVQKLSISNRWSSSSKNCIYYASKQLRNNDEKSRQEWRGYLFLHSESNEWASALADLGELAPDVYVFILYWTYAIPFVPKFDACDGSYIRVKSVFAVSYGRLRFCRYTMSYTMSSNS